MPPLALPTPIVSTEWLAAHLARPGLRIVDASTYLPAMGRDAHAEYRAGHIPGAVFADIEWLSDETSPLPHTLLPAERFSERIGALGIGNDDAVVVYDGSGQNFSAPRLWWMLRIFGHDRVAVLDGGLVRWRLDGRALSTDVPALPPARFLAQLDRSHVRDLEAMRDNLASRRDQMVDARSAGRFEGREPEPRAGVRGGHIPGSHNLPYASLVADDGTLRPAETLRAMAVDAGLDPARPIVASCGSGLTACSVVLALTVAGAPTTAVYDGSWTEWGGRADTEVETSPATH